MRRQKVENTTCHSFDIKHKASSWYRQHFGSFRLTRMRKLFGCSLEKKFVKARLFYKMRSLAGGGREREREITAFKAM